MNNLEESSNESFFCPTGVKKRKDGVLKERLRTLILERKMSEPEFFHSIGITRQYWYMISWGIEDTPLPLKIKIAEALRVDTLVIWRNDNGKE